MFRPTPRREAMSAPLRCKRLKDAAAHRSAADDSEIDLLHKMNAQLAAKPGGGQFNFELPYRNQKF